MAKKESTYKLIRVVGLISLIPITLIAGPLTGYIVGDFLRERLGLPYFVLLLSIAIGISGSIFETVRIIRNALWTEERK